MRSIRFVLPVLAAVLVLAACGTSSDLVGDTPQTSLRAAAVSSATIDFESELLPGDYLLSDGDAGGTPEKQVGVQAGVATGISFGGEPLVEGPIQVLGERDFGAWKGNYARVFDSEFKGGLPDGFPDSDECIEADCDLYTDTQGNVLIVQENGTDTPPDDAVGERFTIDFTDFGPTGTVDVHSFFYIDVEDEEAEGAYPQVQFFDSDGEAILVDDDMNPEPDSFPETGNGQSAVWPDQDGPTAPVMGVSRMVVIFAGSGAIDDIVIDVPREEEPSEGCTPGYWRNHAGLGPGPQANMWPDAYDPEETHFEAVFGVDDVTIRRPRTTIDDPLLFDAVKAIGGGENALARHAVAALLNAASPDVAYAYSVHEVITAVQDAYESGEFMDAQNMFVVANEADCPL